MRTLRDGEHSPCPRISCGGFFYLHPYPCGEFFPDHMTPDGATPVGIPELRKELSCLHLKESP